MTATSVAKRNFSEYITFMLAACPHAMMGTSLSSVQGSDPEALNPNEPRFESYGTSSML